MESAIYPPTEVAKLFLQCFDASAIQLFRRFLEHHPFVRKWIIAADFSLHNDRPLDCFAFTILPYDAWPAEIEQDVTQVLPKDLKKSRELDDEAIEWLCDPRRFHVAITVNDRPAVFSNSPGSVALTVAREHIAKTLEQAVQVGAPAEMIARLRKLRQDAQANSFNVGLFADIWLLAVWFAALTILLGREHRCDIVGWFPDRDSMTNYCDRIWRDYALGNTQAFGSAFSVDMTNTQCLAAAPDRSGTKEHMWFDYMIRAADWLAGAVAAWDRSKDLIPADQPKYRQMLEEVIAPAENIILLHLDMTDSGMQFRRIVATPKSCLMLALTFVRNVARRFVNWVHLLFRK